MSPLTNWNLLLIFVISRKYLTDLYSAPTPERYPKGHHYALSDTSHNIFSSRAKEVEVLSAIATGSTNTGFESLTQKDKRQRIACLAPNHRRKETYEHDEIHTPIDEHRNSSKEIKFDVTQSQSQRKSPWINTQCNFETKQVVLHAEGAGIRNFNGLEFAPNLSAEQKDATDWNSIGTSKSQIFEASKSNGSEKLPSNSSSTKSDSNITLIMLQHDLSVPTVKSFNVGGKLDEIAKAPAIANDSDTLRTLQFIPRQEVIPELDVGHKNESMEGPSVITTPLNSIKPSWIGVLSSEQGLFVIESSSVFFYGH